MSDLMGELIEAFHPRPLSPDILGEATGMWDTYIRPKAFEAGCRGLSWNRLHPAFVEIHYGALTWMGLDAFAAFVPAYLASLLRGDTQTPLPAMVLPQLTREEGFEETFDARVAHLTAKQRAAILHVLEALTQSDRYDQYRRQIDAALASWRAVQDLPDSVPSNVATSSPPTPLATEPAPATLGQSDSGCGITEQGRSTAILRSNP